MVGMTGRSTNTNDGADVNDGIAVTSSTSVEIFDAKEARIYIAISVRGGGAWLKLQGATTDDDKKGIFIQKCHTYELHPDNIYTGKISVIADDEDVTIYGTEF